MNIIYYFSATGNSLHTARQLAQKLGETTLIRITGNMEKIVIPEECERIGIVFPVYTYNIPHLVRRFIKLLPEWKGYFFAAATCGEGLGNVFSKMKRALKHQKISLSAGFKVILPINYTPMFDLPSQEIQDSLFAGTEKKVQTITEKIRNNETYFAAPSSLYKILINPGIYYMMGYPLLRIFDFDFRLGKNCTGCGTCAEVCPVSNITMVKKKPKWHHRCEQCIACLHWCPPRAIEYRKDTLKRGRYHHPAVTLQDIKLKDKKK